MLLYRQVPCILMIIKAMHGMNNPHVPLVLLPNLQALHAATSGPGKVCLMPMPMPITQPIIFNVHNHMHTCTNTHMRWMHGHLKHNAHPMHA
jgi:hypothetical protein